MPIGVEFVKVKSKSDLKRTNNIYFLDYLDFQDIKGDYVADADSEIEWDEDDEVGTKTVEFLYALDERCYSDKVKVIELSDGTTVMTQEDFEMLI